MKATIISVAVALVLIGGSFVFSKSGTGTEQITEGNNVSIVDGKQIIDLRAKGGYSPRRSIAKAGIPTILRLSTNGTFDCSSSIRIPSMNITKNLPNSGTTDIDLGNPQVATINGSCGMGMYPFEIIFN